uniref:DUF4371 domain-containing protein n=1 Tax=Lactuca sativa TaxID=4236 RepID=A0A9R1UMD6_LACSA|nr:hypothetical protein LSAT_V11C800445180 [Lactuca sativa]
METSNNRGNFIELLQFLDDHSQNIKGVTFNNSPLNFKLTSLDMRKYIVHVVANEIKKIIINDIGESFFSLLVDESRDISIKEQMRVMLRLRGQGYVGASNINGELGGLKTLILNENESAYYLQLTLVAVAKNNSKILSLFVLLTNVMNVVGGSCKRFDHLREQQTSKVIDILGLAEIISDRGLNQETSFIKPRVYTMISLFPSILDVLEIITEDGATPDQKCETDMLINSLETFDFIFSLHLVIKLLGITNELS